MQAIRSECRAGCAAIGGTHALIGPPSRQSGARQAFRPKPASCGHGSRSPPLPCIDRASIRPLKRAHDRPQVLPMDGGAPEGGGEAHLLAAYALHADQEDRRSSASSVATASSGAGTYYTCTAGSWADAGSLRSLSGSFSYGARRPPSASSGARRLRRGWRAWAWVPSPLPLRRPCQGGVTAARSSAVAQGLSLPWLTRPTPLLQQAAPTFPQPAAPPSAPRWAAAHAAPPRRQRCHPRSLHVRRQRRRRRRPAWRARSGSSCLHMPSARPATA